MKCYLGWMKKTLISAGAVIAAVLVILSAGCVTPSTGSSSPAGIPVVTTEKNVSGAAGLPDRTTSAALVMTATAVGDTVNTMVATKGDTVAVYYTGTFENG